MVTKAAKKTVKKAVLTIEQVIPGFRAGAATGAGILLDTKGKPYRLDLLDAKALKKMNWKNATAWAKKAGGALPDRRELRMLWVHLRDKFQTDGYYWSSEPYAGNADYAWYQNFTNGTQWNHHKRYELLAVAVRRTPL